MAKAISDDASKGQGIFISVMFKRLFRNLHVNCMYNSFLFL